MNIAKNKINDKNGLNNSKLRKPTINKIRFNEVIRKFVKKIELVFLIKIWCKWSLPARKGFWLFFKRIALIERNS